MHSKPGLLHAEKALSHQSLQVSVYTKRPETSEWRAALISAEGHVDGQHCLQVTSTKLTHSLVFPEGPAVSTLGGMLPSPEGWGP